MGNKFLRLGFQLLIFNYSLLIITSCSVQKQISRSATQLVIKDFSLHTAHVGISIYEPAANKYWFNYQGDKYFVPASNTKIPTCYAAMKYLGDSLVGLKYGIPEEKWWNENVIVIDASGDPTFLHQDFKRQPVFDFLSDKIFFQKKKPGFLVKNNKVERWGSGWSWNDYEADYMAERSTMPIFGNVVNVKLLDTSLRKIPATDYPWIPKYQLFTSGVNFFDSLLNNPRRPSPPISKSETKDVNPKIVIKRNIAYNSFSIQNSFSGFKNQIIPFVTSDWSVAITILMDTLKSKLALVDKVNKTDEYIWESDDSDFSHFHIKKWYSIYSQPTDSLLKPMMHRSDNFFAEQSLLMVSNEMLGVMNDEKIIDTLLKTDFKDLPQKPRWVDGSGLSRYNLFTPQDFVFILNKMKNEFGMERIKIILPTGGEGTISNYYKADSNYIYAKTGSLSGVVSLSGYLYTKKNKLLVFSILVNNQQGSATDVRKAVEKFIKGVRNKY
jgi:D-alanyl-D-alanine carboxypeptidase/D-alanyl-D-alanine-endopeptidase (penicillin-binding protein 4)